MSLYNTQKEFQRLLKTENIDTIFRISRLAESTT